MQLMSMFHLKRHRFTYGDCFLIICVRNYLKRECAHSDEIINDLDFWKSVFSLLQPLPVYIFAVVVLVLCFISFLLTFHLLFLFLFSSSYYLLLRLIIIFKQVTICSKSHIQSWWLKVGVWLRPEFVPKANNYRPVGLLNLYSFSAEMFTRGLLSDIRSIKLLNHRTEDLCAHVCICMCVCVCVCVRVCFPELAGNDETAITDYQAGFHQNHSSLDLSCFFSLYKALTEP